MSSLNHAFSACTAAELLPVFSLLTCCCLVCSRGPFAVGLGDLNSYRQRKPLNLVLALSQDRAAPVMLKMP